MSNNNTPSKISFEPLALDLTDFISLLFKNTDSNGNLTVLENHYYTTPPITEKDSVNESDIYTYKVRWNDADRDNFTHIIRQHISLICSMLNSFDNPLNIKDKSEAKKVLTPQEYYNFWDKYLTPVSVSGFDEEKISDIYDRIETLASLDRIKTDLSNGSELNKYELEFFDDYKDTVVSQEEKNYYNEYASALEKEALARIGGNLCAYETLVRSRRLCRLLALKAPKDIYTNEARHLVVAMLMNKYGISD